MTHRQLQIGFERAAKLADPTLEIENKLNSDTIFAWEISYALF